MLLSNARPYALLAVALVGCLADPADDDVEDGIDDVAVDAGKADGPYAEGSPEALGILAVANDLRSQDLHEQVTLAARPAAAIHAHRWGPDQLEYTADDDPFDSLAELDAVAYVGPVAFNKLAAWARGNGYIVGGPNYDDIFAIGANDVWAVGAAGLVEHWNGTSWTRIPSNVTAALHAVWGTGPSDVWIVGDDTTVLRWNGTALTHVATGAEADIGLTGVSGSGTSNVWIVGARGEFHSLMLRWNGSAFVKMQYNCQTAPISVAAVSPTEVWVGGAQESMCRFNGTGWTDVSPYQTNASFGIGDIYRAPSGNVYITMGGAVWKRSNNTWSKMFAIPYVSGGPPRELQSITGFGDNQLWASGQGGHIARWNGSSWQVTHLAGNAQYTAITGTSSTDVWTVGFGARARRSGATWSTAP